MAFTAGDKHRTTRGNRLTGRVRSLAGRTVVRLVLADVIALVVEDARCEFFGDGLFEEDLSRRGGDAYFMRGDAPSGSSVNARTNPTMQKRRLMEQLLHVLMK